MNSRDRRPRPDRHSPSERERVYNSRRSDNIVFGVSPVLETLRADPRRVDRVMIAQGAKEARLFEVIDLCRSNAIPFTRVAREALEKYADRGANLQGLLAFVSPAGYSSVDEVLDGAGETPLIVVLDGVEDPRNFGAIIRTAECAGADGIIIPDRRSVGLTDTVAKASAGAVEHLKVAKTQNLNRLIEDLKRRDVWVVGTSVDAKITHDEWDWTRPSALVLGGEGRGLHRLVAENCDILVKIPMYGRIDSLNVSVAAGVILFEARRQRKAAETA
ncbi:MAG: 23S rRNA (guanosine(2251)-2'-O)-methyltransferase RlmB [Acidobacteria bacterium ACB1]|nr:putative TrmH family tRNA/rRNA methyltransferase [Pyrinomonadaceae bacterium]MCE7962076.1 23S rRNA (guanosine(2251)-2'-O)-methyltransferase RlmB [Acidobacteria bacterium ACB1]RIJ95443.1 MAG: 23S rRNA (guanosine(2251)-2'-O)-methyltransferase RlmB [Acidobacteriota bacterium]